MATTSKSTENKNTAANDVFSAFSAFPAAFMTNLPSSPMEGSASWWQAYMTGATEMNKEFMTFVATRLQHDAQLGQSLAKCSDWSAAASVHQDWLRKMSEEYTGEAQRLMAIASSTAQQSWAGAHDSSETDSQAGDSNKK